MSFDEPLSLNVSGTGVTQDYPIIKSDISGEHVILSKHYKYTSYRNTGTCFAVRIPPDTKIRLSDNQKYLFEGASIKTIIVGLGNTLLSDDGVGIYIADECRKSVDREDVTILEGGMDGITLLGLLIEYDRAIFVDAVQTGEQKPGHIYRIDPDSINMARYPRITHGIDLIAALELGRKLDLTVPRKIIIYAVEVSDVTTMSETCTPDVQKAVPLCTKMIIQELD
jgi:hydrogenase maturation protease